MTAPLAVARWLPINNSHITQVQRGEPDEPPAGAHLLSVSLWPVGVPDARHSFRESVAWLMHVDGLGLVSVRPWAAYLLQGLHMFLLNGINTPQMSSNGKQCFSAVLLNRGNFSLRGTRWANPLRVTGCKWWRTAKNHIQNLNIIVAVQ